SGNGTLNPEGRGERIENPLEMYLSDVFTIPANLAGIPGISIPCGFTRDNLPIGMQLMGKHFDEITLLKVAYAFERETDYHLRRPETTGEDTDNI
ncbi:MAG: amidase family protein, partial [Candidatus Brocadiales bacterium]